MRYKYKLYISANQRSYTTVLTLWQTFKSIMNNGLSVYGLHSCDFCSCCICCVAVGPGLWGRGGAIPAAWQVDPSHQPRLLLLQLYCKQLYPRQCLLSVNGFIYRLCWLLFSLFPCCLYWKMFFTLWKVYSQNCRSLRTHKVSEGNLLQWFLCVTQSCLQYIRFFPAYAYNNCIHSS